MPTLQPRLNVVLEPDIYDWIARLADRKGLSRSLVARDLLREALELYEDIHWQKQAAARDKTFSVKKALSHKEVWG